MRSLRVWLLLLALFTTFQSAPQRAYADDAAPAAAGESKDGEKKSEKEQESYIVWVIKTSGAIGAVILMLSFYFITLLVQRYMDMREQVTCPPEVLAQCQQFLEQRDFRGLYTFVKAEQSYFSKLVATGLAEMPHGVGEAREAMDRVAEAETVDMEGRISMFAVMGSLGPMIGLLGTLKGMIGSFGEIAHSGTELKADKVAEHISEALLLTFEGVALSVPAIYFFAVFKNRVSHLSVNGALKADEFLRQVAAALKQKTPVGPRV